MPCRPAQPEVPRDWMCLCWDARPWFLPSAPARPASPAARMCANGSQAGDAHVLNDRDHTKMAAAELWARWLALLRLSNPAWEDLRSAWTELDEVFQAGDSSLAALWGCAFGRWGALLLQLPPHPRPPGCGEGLMPPPVAQGARGAAGLCQRPGRHPGEPRGARRAGPRGSAAERGLRAVLAGRPGVVIAPLADDVAPHGGVHPAERWLVRDCMAPALAATAGGGARAAGQVLCALWRPPPSLGAPPTAGPRPRQAVCPVAARREAADTERRLRLAGPRDPPAEPSLLAGAVPLSRRQLSTRQVAARRVSTAGGELLAHRQQPSPAAVATGSTWSQPAVLLPLQRLDMQVAHTAPLPLLHSADTPRP